jgi:hypothetical protein
LSSHIKSVGIVAAAIVVILTQVKHSKKSSGPTIPKIEWRAKFSHHSPNWGGNFDLTPTFVSSFDHPKPARNRIWIRLPTWNCRYVTQLRAGWLEFQNSTNVIDWKLRLHVPDPLFLTPFVSLLTTIWRKRRRSEVFHFVMTLGLRELSSSPIFFLSLFFSFPYFILPLHILFLLPCRNFLFHLSVCTL